MGNQAAQREQELISTRQQLSDFVDTAMIRKTETTQTHDQILALQNLCNVVASSGPMEEEVTVLKSYFEDDKLLFLALDTIPTHALQNGVPTLRELQVQFHDDVKPG